MEDHRLKVMEEYDYALFKQLYKETKPLRNRLASEINPRQLGLLTKEDVLAEFDVKLIFIFDKYKDQMSPQLLKGHILSGLQLYKSRLLRGSMTRSYEVVRGSSSLEDSLIQIPELDEDESKEPMFEGMMEYLRNNLTPDEFLIMCCDAEPPIYIRTKMEEMSPIPKKVPPVFIAEYLDWAINPTTLSHIERCRKRVASVVKSAEYRVKLKP